MKGTRMNLAGLAVVAVLLAATAGLLWVMPVDAAKGDKAIAMIVVMDGTVSLQKAGTGQWAAAKPQTWLYEDDLLKTDKRSHAAILYVGDATELKVNSETTVNVGTRQKTVQSAGAVAKRTVQLLMGQVWGKFSKTKETNTMYQIKTASAVAAVKGTKMDTEAFNSGASNFTVLEGLVNVSNDQGSVDVGAGQTTSVKSGGAPDQPKAADLSKRNPWENGISSPQELILKIKDKGKDKDVKLRLQKKQ